MTEQELYRCESHEKRISDLESGFHAQDKYTAVLGTEVHNLATTVTNLTKTVTSLDGTINLIRNELNDIIPKIKVSKQWEDIYRSGITFLAGLIIAGVVSMVFDWWRNLHGR